MSGEERGGEKRIHEWGGEREEERRMSREEKGILYMLAHSPKGHNSCGCATLKLGDGKFFQVSHISVQAIKPGLLFTIFSEALTEY